MYDFAQRIYFMKQAFCQNRFMKSKPIVRQIGVKMKRKKLYISGATLLVLAIAIYTIVSFNTTPTKKEEEQSVFDNALQLVETSFTDNRDTIKTAPQASELELRQRHADITIIDMSDSLEDVMEENANATVSNSNDTKRDATDDVQTNEIKETNEKVETKIAKETKNTETKSTDSTAKNEKKETKNEDAKSNQKEEPEDEVLTIMSISNSTCEDEDIAICIADSYLNIREDATTDSKILGKLYKNNAAHILETKNDWLYIESGNVKGYVKADYVKSGLDKKKLSKYGTSTALVKCDGLNVRESASTDAKRVDVIYNGEKYPILKHEDEWVKIKIEDDNVEGYVKLEFVEVAMSFSEAISIEEEEALKKAEAASKEQTTQTTQTAQSTKPKKTQGSSTSHTTDELTLLACLVHAEAGNQTYEGKLAVANVVLNRVKSSKYANSISGVIYQKGQFSVASSGSLAKQISQYSKFNSKSQKLSIQAAKDALNGVNNIGKRLYFNRYSKKVASSHSSNGVKIDDQFFW